MLRILQFECQRFVYNLRQIASAMVQIVREIGECTFVVIFFEHCSSSKAHTRDKEPLLLACEKSNGSASVHRNLFPISF
jgi:hypothetical protein